MKITRGEAKKAFEGVVIVSVASVVMAVLGERLLVNMFVQAALAVVAIGMVWWMVRRLKKS